MGVLSKYHQQLLDGRSVELGCKTFLGLVLDSQVLKITFKTSKVLKYFKFLKVFFFKFLLLTT